VRLRHVFIALIALGASPLMGKPMWAQDVQVRLYTTSAPKEVTVASKEGQFRWRTCTTCPDHVANKLVVNSGAGAASAGNRDIFISGSYQMTPATGPSFTASFSLHIEKKAEGLVIIAAMPLEEYVAAVMAAESGDFRNVESRKAMAVVVRTYAVRFQGQHSAEGFDFCDSTHCQVMRWNAVDERTRSAVAATRNEILWYRDAPAATYYHQNCGGMTEAAREAWPGTREPYLSAHADNFCLSAGGLKWESSIVTLEMDKALRAAGISPPGGWSAIEVESRTESGRAQKVRLLGGTPTRFEMSASSFRFAVDRALGWNKIRSDLYEVRKANEQIIFTGRGSGHGVGLCQAGTEEMAREGKNYREILEFYFPGTRTAPVKEWKWQNRFSERFELFSTEPESDSAILAIANRTLEENESALGWKLPFRVRLQVFPSLDRYRDTTGQPGWVAASTRVHTIRLQPLAELRSRSVLESTLRHELYHLLIEVRAKAGTPLWYREGVVLYLSNPNATGPPAAELTDQQVERILLHSTDRGEIELAYAAAQRRVAGFIARYGREKVLSWLSAGIPRDVSAGPADRTQLPANH
jgi:stage II sporulation protein D